MKTLKILALSLISALTLNSCLVDDEASNADKFANTPLAVGFTSALRSVNHFSDVGDVEYSFNYEVIGGQFGLSNTDRNVTIEVDPASTAQAGVEYDFIDSSTSLPIIANQPVNSFKLNVHTGNFNPSEPTELIINIISTDGIISSDTQDSMKIVFVGCLADVENYNYDLVVDYTATDGTEYNGLSRPNQSITSTGEPNEYITDTTGHWLAGDLAPGADGFIFTVICGEVFIETQQLGDYWANTVEGWDGPTNPTGTVDPVTGDITMQYKVCFGGACREYDAVYTQL